MLKRNVRGGKPSDYPRWPFHGLRCAQLLSSMTVSGIMAYFIYYLKKESFPIPWTFIVLFSISLATIASLLITIILYNFTFLSPRFNLGLNGGISFFWAMGLGMLSWSVSSSHVLNKACTGSVWGGEAEAGICRDYKTLWSMTLVGTVSTLLALALDLQTWKKSTRRGAYVMPEDDKDAQKMNDLKNPRVRDAGYEAPREQDANKSTGSTTIWQEQDIGYHNQYGAEEAHGPLDGEEIKDMRYQNRHFRD
ncbi:hypothetical protein LHYA1_G004123 [Lachnellula hyalina]|uniref:MARVEL domain-containing protein n=1 Tax=Lachnellula hyalina TaxID=1316788 RepID=A0A8H8R171_9HELO|nr:uncharacterized protein LHYA1_G004123 [Lachnellula hyalina]TVY26642.1 hypothetical protein LHYA1_G004123 [Lachnellula hyalina]